MQEIFSAFALIIRPRMQSPTLFFVGMFVRPNHVAILDDETGSGRESGNVSPAPSNSSLKDKSPTTQVKYFA